MEQEIHTPLLAPWKVSPKPTQSLQGYMTTTKYSHDTTHSQVSYE